MAHAPMHDFAGDFVLHGLYLLHLCPGCAPAVAHWLPGMRLRRLIRLPMASSADSVSRCVTTYREISRVCVTKSWNATVEASLVILVALGARVHVVCRAAQRKSCANKGLPRA